MFKYRIRMFLNELKVLAFMRSGGSSPGAARRARTPRVVRAGLGALGGALRGDCSRWPPFDCSERGEGGDDAEEYYGCSEPARPRSSEPARPRSLALEDPAKPLDTAAPSLPSLTAGGLDPSLTAGGLDPSLDTGHASLPSLTESGIGSPQCRICFQGLEQGELLSACRCAGSVRCTHQPCLIRWISERGSWSCELCYFKYHVLAISTKNPLQWQAISLTVIEKVQIAAIFLGSLFLIASISWLVWSSFSPSARWQRQDLLFQICYGMYGFMDIVCIGLIIHEGSSVYRIFQRWQAVNQQWKILNYDKQKDLGGASSGGDAHKGGASSGGAAHPTGGTDRRGGVRGGRGGASERVRRTLLNHHCGSSLLHMLSQFRAHRPPPGSSNHEVVMRVTTV